MATAVVTALAFENANDMAGRTRPSELARMRSNAREVAAAALPRQPALAAPAAAHAAELVDDHLSALVRVHPDWDAITHITPRAKATALSPILRDVETSGADDAIAAIVIGYKILALAERDVEVTIQKMSRWKVTAEAKSRNEAQLLGVSVDTFRRLETVGLVTDALNVKLRSTFGDNATEAGAALRCLATVNTQTMPTGKATAFRHDLLKSINEAQWSEAVVFIKSFIRRNRSLVDDKIVAAYLPKSARRSNARFSVSRHNAPSAGEIETFVRKHVGGTFFDPQTGGLLHLNGQPDDGQNCDVPTGVWTFDIALAPDGLHLDEARRSTIAGLSLYKRISDATLTPLGCFNLDNQSEPAQQLADQLDARHVARLRVEYGFEESNLFDNFEPREAVKRIEPPHASRRHPWKRRSSRHPSSRRASS